MKLPNRKVVFQPPSNHHFSGSMLNFGGARLFCRPPRLCLERDSVISYVDQLPSGYKVVSKSDLKKRQTSPISPKVIYTTRWASTSYKWDYNVYKFLTITIRKFAGNKWGFCGVITTNPSVTVGYFTRAHLVEQNWYRPGKEGIQSRFIALCALKKPFVKTNP